ncbi:hypothetical protein T310_9415, partial [Rasamsonia emersonii CBS 393.64]
SPDSGAAEGSEPITWQSCSLMLSHKRRGIQITNVINHRATNTTERRIFLHPTTSFFQRVILSPPLSKMPLSQENRIQMAIAAYKNQKVKSILKAAEIFGVPEATLRARLKGRQPRAETRANGHRLKAIEEETLIQRLLEADKRGFPIRPEFLRSMAQILLRERLQ